MLWLLPATKECSLRMWHLACRIRSPFCGTAIRSLLPWSRRNYNHGETVTGWAPEHLLDRFAACDSPLNFEVHGRRGTGWFHEFPLNSRQHGATLQRSRETGESVVLPDTCEQNFRYRAKFDLRPFGFLRKSEANFTNIAILSVQVAQRKQ